MATTTYCLSCRHSFAYINLNYSYLEHMRLIKIVIIRCRRMRCSYAAVRTRIIYFDRVLETKQTAVAYMYDVGIQKHIIISNEYFTRNRIRERERSLAGYVCSIISMFYCGRYRTVIISLLHASFKDRFCFVFFFFISYIAVPDRSSQRSTWLILSIYITFLVRVFLSASTDHPQPLNIFKISYNKEKKRNSH